MKTHRTAEGTPIGETRDGEATGARSSEAGGDAAAVSAALAGAAIGSLAGPPGAIAGGIAGAAIGLVARVAIGWEEQSRRLDDERLDREIGVTEGSIGAASPDQPPARVGAFSGGAMGIAPRTSTPGEGPMQGLDDDG
jgi:hypothetical protein